MALFNFLVSCRLFVVLFLLLDFPHGLHADKTRLKKYKRVTRKLTESFRSCGLRVRGEGSSAKDSLSDVFADYEWESINKKSLKRPLVAAVYGQKRTMTVFQHSLSSAFYDTEKCHKHTIDICEYVAELQSGKSQDALQERMMGFVRDVDADQRIIIYAQNFAKCITKSTLLLLNVFLDPWNGERAFLATRSGETKVATNIIWLLEFKHEEINKGKSLLSSGDFRGFLEKLWTSDDTANQQITGEAYLGRLSHIVSIDDSAETKNKVECDKLLNSDPCRSSNLTTPGNSSAGISLTSTIIVAVILVIFYVAFSNRKKKLPHSAAAFKPKTGKKISPGKASSGRVITRGRGKSVRKAKKS